MLERLGGEVDEAIDELRTVAQGVYPQLLAQRGAARRLPRAPLGDPVSVRDAGVGRHSEPIETTVFCCLERQNASKHAGPGAAVTIRLSEAEGHVRFSVEEWRGLRSDAIERRRRRPHQPSADRVAAVGGRSGSTPLLGGEPASAAASPPSQRQVTGDQARTRSSSP